MKAKKSVLLLGIAALAGLGIVTSTKDPKNGKIERVYSDLPEVVIQSKGFEKIDPKYFLRWNGGSMQVYLNGEIMGYYSPIESAPNFRGSPDFVEGARTQWYEDNREQNSYKFYKDK